DDARAAGRAGQPPDPHLVRGGIDRTGAVFARDVPARDAEQARRLANRDPRHRHLQRSAGEGEGGTLHAVRGPARTADRAPGQILFASRRIVADRARNPMVQFRPLNLVQEISLLGFFDVVFCRNVLIYFDQDTKTKVLRNIARAMRPDGYLVLGAAETVVGLTDAFEPAPDQRGLYGPTPLT